jgi:hypothetical protein
MPDLESIFTFEHRETGERRTVLASDEKVARLQLGGYWENEEKSGLLYECSPNDLHALVERAIRDEEETRGAMLAANPIGRASKVTRPESLAEDIGTKT